MANDVSGTQNVVTVTVPESVIEALEIKDQRDAAIKSILSAIYGQPVEAANVSIETIQ